MLNKSAPLNDVELFFKQCLESVGHPLNSEMQFDSDWQQYPCPESRKSKTSARYKAYSDGRPILLVQCRRCHEKVIKFPYKGDKIYKITPEQRALNNQKFKEKKKKEAELRSQILNNLQTEWNSAPPCLEHKYFNRKGGLILTEADGLRIDKQGRIFCPLRTIDGKLISAQAISYKGEKTFYKGLLVAGGIHIFGSIENSNIIYFGEGIATCLTIRLITECAVVCCYGKKFSEIAPIIAKNYPNKKFIYCCDLSSNNEKATSEKNARKAITLAGGFITLPNFSEIPLNLEPDVDRTDFNDLFVLLLAQGLNRTAALGIVRQQLENNLLEVIMTENKKEKKASSYENEDRIKVAEALLQIIDQGEFEFFHDENQEAFCKYPSQKSNVYEVRRLNDIKFKSYLSFIYRKAEGKTIGEQPLKEAIAEMEGRALHDSESKQHKVFLRIGELNKKIYIDLCNNKWQAIEISAAGWKILDSKDIPVRFERSQHALPLPDPHKAQSGDINKLWQLVNCPKEDQILVLAFMLECYRCSTAFPILTLLGLQDSGKSATQNTIRSLIDPSSSNLRTAPRKVDDLVVEAISNWLVSYNNVSHLTDEMHDDFCCVATGSGFATRKFYTNTQQIVVNIARPVIINGIFNFIRRPDLLDRAIILELDSIDESKRKTDSQLNKAIWENLPSIFRGLMDLLVKVLQLLPSVRLDKQPRMADFALLGVATEKALGLPENTFINRYRANRANAKGSILDSSPIMLALGEYIEIQENKFWRGRPSELLEELTKFKNPSSHTTWPKTAHAMGGELKQYIAPLRSVGIEVINEAKLTGTKNRNGNFYRINKVSDPSKPQDAKTSPPYPPSPQSDDELNNDEALQEIDGMDIGVDIAVELSTISTQSPPINMPVSPHDTCISSIPVDIVDLVDIKTQRDTSGTADDNSIII